MSWGQASIAWAIDWKGISAVQQHATIAPHAWGRALLCAPSCAALTNTHLSLAPCPSPRDYGLYDMAQLRFPGTQLLGDCLYRRRCAL